MEIKVTDCCKNYIYHAAETQRDEDERYYKAGNNFICGSCGETCNLETKEI